MSTSRGMRAKGRVRLDSPPAPEAREAPPPENHGLGFEAPYRSGPQPRTYLPDFIVLFDDGHGEDGLLRLIIEVKGYRGEDAKDKKAAMETCWVPGVNRHGGYGRWAFAEFRDVYTMEEDLEAEVEAAFDAVIEGVLA